MFGYLPIDEQFQFVEFPLEVSRASDGIPSPLLQPLLNDQDAMG